MNNPDRYFHFLRNVYFFKELGDDDISRILTFCHEETYDKGDIVFVEGARAEKFYIIISGVIEVWKNYFEDTRDLLAVHGPGQFFGEMALIDDLPRSATVVSRDITRVLFLYRNDFHDLIKENSSIALSIMMSFSMMVRRGNDTIIDSLKERNILLERTNLELKKAHDEVLRAERLSTLGKFSSLILHDIRNPLSILRGYAEMLLVNSDEPDKTQKYSQKIISEADRLNRLASELLDYSRGEIRLNVAPVNIVSFFEKLKDLLLERYGSRGIHIDMEILYTGRVIFDEERMLRVFLNICDNAKKAMAKGGTLSLSVKEENGMLHVAVSDTGTGMSAEVLENVFEPFFTSSAQGGTGLGMLIVKSIIDAHEGLVHLESTVGRGTTVHISIPLRS